MRRTERAAKPEIQEEVCCEAEFFRGVGKPRQLLLFNRGLLICAAAAMIALFVGVFGSSAASDDNEAGDRVQSWAVGHIAPLPGVTAQYNNQTLREIVHTSVGGDEVRVRISNTFGTAPLVVGQAHVAVWSSGSSLISGTDRALTLGGRRSMTIPAGASAVRGPARLHVPAVSDLAVPLHEPPQD